MPKPRAAALNVEILRLLAEAFNRQDLDDGMQYMDPAVELYPGVPTPDQEMRFVGREGVRRFLLGASEAWESVTVDRAELIEGPRGRVLAVDRWLFRGRDGIEIERELPTVYTFENGLITRIDGFTDRAEALAALNA